MRRTTLAACAALVTVGIAGCSRDPDTGPTMVPTVAGTSTSQAPSASPSPTSTVYPKATSQAEVDSAEAALDAYLHYSDATVAALAHPDKPPSTLRDWAEGQALKVQLSWMKTLVEQGVVYKGRPKLHPEVLTVDEAQGLVTIGDCTDNSGWTPVDAKSGKSRLAPNQQTRVWLKVRVGKSGDRWIVVSAKSDREKPC